MIFEMIYVEEEILNEERTKVFLQRFPKSQKVIIQRYGEVFNRKGQNFRLQKKSPALILAKKHQNLILKIPDGYGIGSQNNFYFSHLLNCPFDCRYCFLQGMFNSANYVFFINFEDFQSEIEKKDSQETTFFTGYDCDSLAFEGITHFANSFLPFIEKRLGSFEFRTKSVEIRPFLKYKPLKNCILSWTLSLEEVQKSYEHRTPSSKSRLAAMQRLQEVGWMLGIRLDPLFLVPSYKEKYKQFFKEIFSVIKEKHIHSVTLGDFRVPKSLFKKMASLYPKEPLFAKTEEKNSHLIGTKEDSPAPFCQKELLNYLPQEKIFCCYG